MYVTNWIVKLTERKQAKPQQPAEQLQQTDVISSGKRCPKCNDQGWLYDEEGNKAGTCPCHL